MTTDTNIHSADNDVCGEHLSKFSNDYERKLRTEGAAIGESARSDLQLDAFRKLLTNSDDAIQKALFSRERRHEMHFAAGAVCLLKTAEHSQGYLDNLLEESNVVAARNAASPERAKISAIIRLTTSTVTSDRDVSVRLSRLSKTAAGLVLECNRLGIAVHLGNIAQVIDIALGHSRSYFQKLVDAQDTTRPGEANEATETNNTAPTAPQVTSATPDTLETTDAGATLAASSEEVAPMDNAEAESPAPMTLKVLPSPQVSEAVRPPLIGTLPNKHGLECGVIVLIGCVEGDTIGVRGPITIPVADELLNSLENLFRSAA